MLYTFINKKSLQKFLHFILSHALWVALCAASLVFQTIELLHLPVNYYLLAFVFFATLCSYNFHFLLGNVFGGEKIILKLYNHYSSIFFLLTGAAGMLILFSATHISIVNVAAAFLLTFLYSIPLLPVKQLAFTRKAGFVKTILLAFTWMFVTAYLPISQYHKYLSLLDLLLLTKRFLFMLMLCILFDNRDAAVDIIRGLHSLATDLSPALMKWLIYILFVLLFVINYLLGHYGITIRQRIALQLTSIATLVTYFFSTKKQGYLFYYFIVDGLMFLSALLVTIASI